MKTKSGAQLCSGIVYQPFVFLDVNCYLKPVGYESVASRQIGSTYAELRLDNETWLED